MKLMTPGPTQVRQNVMEARSRAFVNPDLDLTFYDYYRKTCERLEQALGATDHKAYILG
jgi:aspartate aminotransferase-like enzyme